MDQRPDPKELIKQRKDFADKFDDTLIRMWKEKIKVSRKTRSFRSGTLYRSVYAPLASVDIKATKMSWKFSYRHYGVFVERGTGRGVFRGNNGDIGRDNKRRKRPWMNPKYYLSVCNLRDFLADSLGQEAVQVVSSVSSEVYDPIGSKINSLTGRRLAIPGTNLPL